MTLSHDSDSGPQLPDELVDAAIEMANSDPFIGELDDLAVRLRCAAATANGRGLYGLDAALDGAATSAASWARGLER